ncbi:hypothetical protein GYH30_015931 [Glycine max]|uniref:Uncharacterized protein n=1 Tax=Glycine max TaxID=3847 RepID=A0A0R0JKH7_SOYBN|nr:hypothetical protein GYH30_015931 [Glycine max]
MRSLKIKTRMEEWKKKKEGRCKAFGWFKTHVLDSKLEIGINHQELCSLLSLGGKAKDSHISLLIMADILGRKEIISLLNRHRYKEMMLVSLEKKRLRMCPLDIRFLLRDLIGFGHLKTYQTPTSLIIRVSKD